jgi:alpha-L-rhamnosidase
MKPRCSGRLIVKRDAHIYIDGQEKENLIANINLNPLGKVEILLLIQWLQRLVFRFKKGKAYFSNVEIRNYRGPGNVLFSEDSETSIRV